MPTRTVNHIYGRINLRCISGPFIGEQASWGLRLGLGTSYSLQSGLTNLSNFNVADTSGTTTPTFNTRVYTCQVGWVGVGTVGDPLVPTQTDIDAVAGAFDLFFTGPRSYINSMYKLEDIRVYAVDQTGHAPGQPCIFTPNVQYLGGNGSPITPDVAACVSLYTAERSKRGRGRFYFGPLGVSVYDANGLFSSAFISALQTPTVTMLNGWRARTPVPLTPMVWSRLEMNKGAIINRVRIGDEPDGHETRTKQRAEVYTSVNLT